MGIFRLVQHPRMQVLGSMISRPMFNNSLSSLPREIVLRKLRNGQLTSDHILQLKVDPSDPIGGTFRGW